MVDMSMLAPEMPSGGNKPMPGQMESFKAALQALQKQGLSVEEIIEAALSIAEQLGLELSREQLMGLIGQQGAMTEAPPNMAGEMPATM